MKSTSTFILSLTFIFASLTACTNSKSGTPTLKTRLAILQEKASNCERKIKNQMADASIAISSEQEFPAETAKIKPLLSHATEIVYNVSKAPEIIAIGTEHYGFADQEETSFVQIEYDLTKKQGDDSLGFNLKASFRNIELNKESITLSQTYNVDIENDCKLNKTSTGYESITKKANDFYSFKTKTFYSNGQIDLNSKEFKHTKNEPLENIRPTREPSKNIHTYYVFSDNVGVIEMKRTQSEDKNVSEFGLTKKFDISKFDLSINDTVIMSTVWGTSVDEEITFTEHSSHTLWQIPKELWNTLYLQSNDATLKIEYKISSKYLRENDSIEVRSEKYLKYPHMTAYWTALSEPKTVEDKFAVQLKEAEVAEYKDAVTKEDLLTNDTIQTQLPEIQKIASDIKNATNDRKEQIEMILKWLSKNYSYDYSMLENNLVRSLTTEDALKTKKGVCQHYAVIFTAVARALNIPSRIVMGYSLSNSAVMHAWNEVEIEEGLWRVVEPQDVDGLKRIYTRFYFPLVRAGFLEDKNVSYSENLLQAVTIKYGFYPLK